MNTLVAPILVEIYQKESKLRPGGFKRLGIEFEGPPGLCKIGDIGFEAFDRPQGGRLIYGLEWRFSCGELRISHFQF